MASMIPIIKVKIEEIATPVDFSDSKNLRRATPCRYRLVDCVELVERDILCIYEFKDFPSSPYSAVSYVWKGVTVSAEENYKSFSVRGAEVADPIGIDVLRDACKASLMHEIGLLWLDRLGIMQEHREDKDWQIQEMYRLYRQSALCIIVPGGLHRLVPLGEETTWIHRGWTLQEALAPASCVVLFSWKVGDQDARAGHIAGKIQEVVQGRSAQAPLSLILDACTSGTISITTCGCTFPIETKIFSAQPFNGTFEEIPFFRDTRRIMAPNVSALAVALASHTAPDEREYAIWQSAMMRTSSRPVDMVFSIMGLFDVKLNPKNFGEHDRIPATIALAQEILKKGGRANWLGVSFRSQPCPQLCTFPVFPRTRVAGKALLKLEAGYREVSELMENRYPMVDVLGALPIGHMRSDGYFSFKAKAVPLAQECDAGPRAFKPPRITASDTSMWRIVTEVDNCHPRSPQTFAVLLGCFLPYFPGSTPAIHNDKECVRGVIVREQEQEHGRFYVQTYFTLGYDRKAQVEMWEEHELCVGGPEKLSSFLPEDPNETLVEIPGVDPSYLNSRPGRARKPRNLQEESEQKARFAVTQKYVEGVVAASLQ